MQWAPKVFLHNILCYRVFKSRIKLMKMRLLHILLHIKYHILIRYLINQSETNNSTNMQISLRNRLFLDIINPR
jgi:hypothetical protein